MCPNNMLDPPRTLKTLEIVRFYPHVVELFKSFKRSPSFIKSVQRFKSYGRSSFFMFNCFRWCTQTQTTGSVTADSLMLAVTLATINVL